MTLSGHKYERDIKTKISEVGKWTEIARLQRQSHYAPF